MTTSHILNAVSPLIADLAQDLSERERLRRLLAALRNLLPADAVALLKLEGEWLRPMAIDGLMPDTLGRRFRLGEHPRFAQLLAAGQAMRFEPDSPLPDPYDGLVAHKGQAISELHVHDCMGCVLQLGGLPWGLLTLDALEPGRFADPAALAMLQAFSNLAAATVATAERVHLLSQLARGATGSASPAAPQERGLQGASPVMRQLQKDIALVAASDLCVLVTGETGTGKELVAQAVHAQSGRADKPMISINCAALPDNLVESELFGHVRGAFTGALSERSGKFEQAHQGTLFLDEVGELSLPVQAKLLRVLQSGQLQRLGSDREHHVDVRVIAATNRDLAAEVHAGRMRADFYHRLNVYPLAVPPLRERDSDVLQLAGYFLEENRSRLRLGGLRLDAAAQAALLNRSWPGNVRELEHCISRAVLRALSRNDGSASRAGTRLRIVTLGLADLWERAEAPAAAQATAPMDPATPAAAPEVGLRAAVSAYERQLVSSSLARHRGSWAAAARELQLDRANLQRLAKRLEIDRP
ncbi:MULTISPECIES: nitric oxide reductase transcriptional regulator NorR [Comamonas]|uniref:nitric oxide reductase transcriptional regulator NorR n=1 Tax=Comamonas TaxID=283 RepID=UPI00050FCB28|nr:MULTISPECIES: nitric oxide reductase transcriptional regulator NorR [Comamonas]KGG91426.1 transcriptional regulator [Comamonas thiooxydans]KGG97039.1 transcriptional regulator [Comamonas thiooxydans]KGH05560.1 transcriptional regulator [Comamonas thiooxydans]KGH13426.1 transcriptional regulator [Comamonas thiooxydans]TZG11570.1 nitric oxide reductase transcriptional regulator NorR [Comamonas thiooxydans]